MGGNLEALRRRAESFLPGIDPGRGRDPARAARKPRWRKVAVSESIGQARFNSARAHGPRHRRVARRVEPIYRNREPRGWQPASRLSATAPNPEVTRLERRCRLERDVLVVHRRDVVARASTACGCATTSASARVAGLIAHRSTAPRAQELHAHRDNFRDLALAAAVLGFVFAVGNSPLDINRASLLQILRASLALFAPYDDVVPVGAVLPGPALVRERLLGRNRKVGHRRARVGEASFGIASQIAD